MSIITQNEFLVTKQNKPQNNENPSLNCLTSPALIVLLTATYPCTLTKDLCTRADAKVGVDTKDVSECCTCLTNVVTCLPQLEKRKSPPALSQLWCPLLYSPSMTVTTNAFSKTPMLLLTNTLHLRSQKQFSFEFPFH